MSVFTKRTLTDVQVTDFARHYHKSMKYGHHILDNGLSSQKEFAEVADRVSLFDSLSAMKTEDDSKKYPKTEATTALLHQALGDVTKKANIPGEAVILDEDKRPNVDAAGMMKAMHDVLTEVHQYLDRIKAITANPNDYSTADVEDAKSFHPDMLKSWLRRDIGTAQTDLKELHDKEKEALATQFGTTEFKQALTDDKITDPAAYQKDVLAALEERQKKEMAAFDSLKKEEEQLHVASNKRYEETLPFVLAQRVKANDEQLIAAATDAMGRRGSNQATSGETTSIDGQLFFEDVTAEDLRKLLINKTKTVQGRTLTLDQHSDLLTVASGSVGGTGTWGLQREDLFQLAVAFKGLGKERITIDVSHLHEDKANELAKWAFEEARKAGFEEKDIRIKIGGKLQSKDDLRRVGVNFETKAIKKHTEAESVIALQASDMRDRLHAMKDKATVVKSEDEKLELGDHGTRIHGGTM